MATTPPPRRRPAAALLSCGSEFGKHVLPSLADDMSPAALAAPRRRDRPRLSRPLFGPDAGEFVSGAGGTGKSASITQLGKKFQIETERRTGVGGDRVPVVYIVCPADATPKMPATEMAIFLGLPVAERDSPQSVAHTVATVLRRVGTGLVLIDEIPRLPLSGKRGRDASDQAFETGEIAYSSVASAS